MPDFILLIIGTIVVFLVGVPLSRHLTDRIFRRRPLTAEEHQHKKQFEERKRDALYFWR